MANESNGNKMVRVSERARACGNENETICFVRAVNGPYLFHLCSLPSSFEKQNTQIQ